MRVMSNMIEKMRGNKAFTLVELLIVVLVVGVLVLLAMPKLLEQTEKAELTRIQHDVKVMEQEMKIAMIGSSDDYNSWEDNVKDLGILILRNQLYEKEGLATKVNMNHLTHVNNTSFNSHIGIGGNLYKTHDKLGVGGDNYKLESNIGYKVIPESFKNTVGSKLDGTFYVNSTGKVYYEPNKPLSSVKQDQQLACVSAEVLDYEFDGSTGTIIKYNGNLQYITIPAAFEIDGKCVPVRIIGKGAFMNGNFKGFKIPQSIKEIHEDAFRNNELIKVEIPHSVDIIRSNAFSNNRIENVVINKSSNDISIESGAFSNNGQNGTLNINPTYKIPTDDDLNIIYDKSAGKIISSYEESSSNNYASTAKKYDNSSRIISIPETILVGGVEHKVKEVAKGAFQGQEIIHVEFPDSLEVIEDYAFAGNQLIGVTIPERVEHIGSYAFAFNEVNEKSTINYAEISNEDYKPKIDKLGNIVEHEQKVNLLKGKVELLHHIFITSNAEFEIPVENNPAVKHDNIKVPNKPSVSNVTENGATVNGGEGTEVSIDGIKWYESPHTFIELNEGVNYKVYSRYKETDSHYASNMSEGLNFKTEVSYKTTPMTFTNAGSTGATGPTQSQLDNAYRNTELKGQVKSQNGIQLWTVPKTGMYRIEAYGAQGGSKYVAGGLGAIISGDLHLTSGTKIKVLVGQEGSSVSTSVANPGGTGGGGTFLTTLDNTPLIVAGGGGGSSSRDSIDANNGHALIESSGSGPGGSSTTGLGGVNGNGGKTGGAGTGGGGGGFFSSGDRPNNWSVDTGGQSFVSGGLGSERSVYLSIPGGFGGGAGSGHAGGGGGGYSGGAGGAWSRPSAHGGGGGSYNSGTNQSNSVGNTGHGKVIITYISK